MKILFGSLVAVLIFIIGVSISFINAQAPPDQPCVDWVEINSNTITPDPSTLLVASDRAWVIGEQDDPMVCLERGSVIPCWTTDASGFKAWGHHDWTDDGEIPNDYCRVNDPVSGQIYFANNQYIPKKGPEWKTWSWKLAQTGSNVPQNAIRYGDKIMTKSTTHPSFSCSGVGFTGWAEANADNTFGNCYFAIANQPVQTGSFQYAICNAIKTTTTPAPTPVPTTAAPTTAAPTTPVPTPPPVTPSPTLPPNNKPYIRFAQTAITSTPITATISQSGFSKTWSQYTFGQFSDWEQHFAIGDGVFTLVNATSGATVYNASIYLPPGPLVVAVKGYSPINQFSVEGIAASYLPAQQGNSGVRLFNLMPDVVSAGLKANGKVLVDGVKFTLGSVWATIPDDQSQTYQAFDDQTNEVLASDTFEAPSSPFVFTNFLIGMKNASNGLFQPRFVPLIDAPEF